jgi:Flp pilus assembly protein TadG
MSYRPETHERGQALVEFAFVLPIIVLLTLGLFDFGRAVIFTTELDNASRAGARVAIVNQSDDASCLGGPRTFKCAAADITAGMGIAPTDIQNLVVTGSDCTLPSDCTATVTVTYSYEPVTPLVSSLFGPVNLSSTTTMPLERNYSSP